MLELLFPAEDPAEVPELLDVTEELLLASVDELDFAEEELFFDEDETLLLLEKGLDGSPPLRSEDDSAMELLVSFSGSTKLLLSSSPQAVKARTRQAIAAVTTIFRNIIYPSTSVLLKYTFLKKNWGF
ncbi:MAG: hypothetical protein J5977_11275 [Fibrobacter sp.]|nr:hypothetical protein [Fibrobacter sp.]